MLPRRPLGRTSLSVSPLGLAAARRCEATAVERAFHELGVNYFFVTPSSVAGIQNLVAGGHRDKMVIACGVTVPTGGAVRRQFEGHAKKLGTDVIDVFLLYWVQAHWYVTGKTWPAMRSLKEEGKVKALGVSCHDRPMALALAGELDHDVRMVRYNAAHRGAASEIFAKLPDPRPGVVAYTATRWGKLLEPHGDHTAMTAPECYRFALGHPSVDVALCGAESYAELETDARGVLEGPLPPERLESVHAFGDAVRAGLGRLGFWQR